MNRGIRIFAAGALVLIGWIAAHQAQAMGLGEARVNSFLNQPLDVQVRLLEVSEAELDSLTARVGNAEAYQQLGLMSDVLATGITVTIDRSQRPAVLMVSSQRPITDPVIQLLIDARWSSGRLLREYTLFLDPPTIPMAPPAQTSTPQQPTIPEPRPSANEPSPSPAPVTDADRAPSESGQQTGIMREVPQAIRSSGQRQYTVMPGDTLWSLAFRERPDLDLSMDQTMLAIVDLNPTAFPNGNVNQMLSGMTLELPDRQQIETIDRQSARQAIELQNRSFRQGQSTTLPTVADSEPVRLESPEPTASDSEAAEAQAQLADEPSAAVQAETAPAGNDDDFRLELVPPSEADEGLGLTAEAGAANRSEQQLALSEEERFTAQLEAEDFQNRLDQLEGLVSDNPGGLGIPDLDLAQLQQTLRDARSANTADPLDTEMRAGVSDQVDAYLDQFVAAEELNTQATEVVDATAEPEDVAEINEPVVTQVGTSSGLLNNLVLIGAIVAGLVVLAILALFVLRHIREADEEIIQPIKPKPAAPAKDPVNAAEDRVRADPDNLDAHLALLHTLSADGQEGRFSNALDSMYARVDDDLEPQWQEALALAQKTKPDHPLVLGSLDWEPDADEGEQDAESNMDDMLARMDDQEDESPDRHMLTEDEPDVGLTESTPAPEFALDSGRPEREDRTSSIEDNALDDETDAIAEDQSPLDDAAAEPDQDDDGLTSREPLSMDWPGSDQDDENMPEAQPDEHPPEAGADDQDPGSSQSSPASDDIFSATDEDVDVKLDLAKAYLSWNSIDSAKTLLDEVMREGNPRHQEEARKLLDDLD